LGLGFNSQFALGIVLEIDQPPIALAHTFCDKKWKETKLKTRTSTM
jgi:hypothetical protein